MKNTNKQTRKQVRFDPKCSSKNQLSKEFIDKLRQQPSPYTQKDQPKQTHTPLPWHTRIGKVCFYDEGTNIIGKIKSEWEIFTVSKWDAEFICKAVNNHYQLLEALKISVEKLRTMGIIFVDGEQAISKAEGNN